MYLVHTGLLVYRFISSVPYCSMVLVVHTSTYRYVLGTYYWSGFQMKSHGGNHWQAGPPSDYCRHGRKPLNRQPELVGSAPVGPWARPGRATKIRSSSILCDLLICSPCDLLICMVAADSEELEKRRRLCQCGHGIYTSSCNKVIINVSYPISMSDDPLASHEQPPLSPVLPDARSIVNRFGSDISNPGYYYDTIITF
jgi:hypothetical protein